MIDPAGLRDRVRKRLLEQKLLVRSLLALKEQLQGSLFARYAECGKETCICRRGQKHGPYYVLSTRVRGLSGFAYLEGDKADEARRLVERHKEFQARLRRLRRVNTDLVALLRRYQQQMARQGNRRLGLKTARKTPQKAEV